MNSKTYTQSSIFKFVSFVSVVTKAFINETAVHLRRLTYITVEFKHVYKANLCWKLF